MRKKFFVTLMLVLGLTGCGNQAAQSDAIDAMVELPTEISTEAPLDPTRGPFTPEEWADRQESCWETAQYGDVMDIECWNKPLDPLTIIDDVVSGRREYEKTYYMVDQEGLIYADVFYGGTETRRCAFYPGAVLESEDWQADELVEGYLDESLPWMHCGELDARIFTPDYRTCFIVEDDWLWVNGVKLRPIQDIVGSVHPLDLLYDYQHGLWDGTEPVYSMDYSTMAEISFDGALEYTYRTSEYSDEYDPEHLAYKGYADPPEFMTVGSEFFKTGHTNHYNYDYGNGCTGRVFEADVEVYPDLPDGSKAGFTDVLQFEYDGPENGMYVVTKNGIMRYRRGVLMDTWDLKIDPDYYWINCRGFWNEVHMRISQNEIIRLLPDGQTETVINGLIEGFGYGIGEYSLMDLSLKHGVVTGYCPYYGIVDIAEGISSVDYAWNILLMTGEDGLCYAIDSDDYMELENQMDKRVRDGEKPAEIVGELTPTCLGDKSWEYYLELYRAGLLEMPAVE